MEFHALVVVMRHRHVRVAEVDMLQPRFDAVSHFVQIPQQSTCDPFVAVNQRAGQTVQADGNCQIVQVMPNRPFRHRVQPTRAANGKPSGIGTGICRIAVQEQRVLYSQEKRMPMEIRQIRFQNYQSADKQLVIVVIPQQKVKLAVWRM